MKYIDVSEWQGVVDWEKVKPHVDGVILRAGCGVSYADKQFARNAKECNRLGIPIGAYWFSYAKTAAQAKAEAQALLAAVKPYRMELPLAFDWEYESNAYAIKHGVRSCEDGRVLVRTRLEEDGHVIEITDNGVGFDPNRSADPSGRNHIGLANVRERVAALCGGTLTIDSAPGEGTSVRIRIPLNGKEKA